MTRPGTALASIAMLLPILSCAPAARPVSDVRFALTSEKIALPPDESTLPTGPGVETAKANCLACHSAGMILSQPKLSEKQWAGIVEKMRTTYKAPIAEADAPKIVAYLNGLRTE